MVILASADNLVDPPEKPTCSYQNKEKYLLDKDDHIWLTEMELKNQTIQFILHRPQEKRHQAYKTPLNTL